MFHRKHHRVKSETNTVYLNIRLRSNQVFMMFYVNQIVNYYNTWLNTFRALFVPTLT